MIDSDPVSWTDSQPVSWLIGFVRALRDADLAVDHTRVAVATDALAALSPLGTDEIYWATRLTLCSRQSDLPLFDAVFAAWIGTPPPPTDPAYEAVPVMTYGPAAPTSPTETTTDERELTGTAVGGTDRTATRDPSIPDLTGRAGRAEIDTLRALLVPRARPRRLLRRTPGGHSRIDLGRTVRTMLRNAGEPVRPAYRRRGVRPRRRLLLLDVSESMEPYSDALLRFAYAAVHAGPALTEVFTIGTRCTRITPALRLGEPEVAARAVARLDPGRGGGTRLGVTLRDFLRGWGGHRVVRTATLIIASDGWEYDDPRLLSRQVARLSRLGQRLIWINPQAGQVGFRPTAPGLVRSLRYVDDCVPGHDLAALRRLAELIR